MQTRHLFARTYRRRGIATLTALASVLFFSGCSLSCSLGDSKLTAEEQETQISAAYSEQTGTEMVSIQCEEVAAEVGEKISCQASDADDAKLTIAGEITAANEDDEKVHFDWQVVAAEVAGADYAEAVKQTLEQEAGSPIKSIKCPDRVDMEAGQKFRCTVILPDGEKFGATVNLTDSQGAFEVEVDSEPSS